MTDERTVDRLVTVVGEPHDGSAIELTGTRSAMQGQRLFMLGAARGGRGHSGTDAVARTDGMVSGSSSPAPGS
jgi:hypothetical protein